MNSSTEKIDRDTAILSIAGELDSSTVSAVRIETLSLLETDVHKIIFDLSQTTYIDSAGLGMLIGTLARCKERGGTSVILSPSNEVKKAIKQTKIHQIINTADSRTEALQAINTELK